MISSDFDRAGQQTGPNQNMPFDVTKTEYFKDYGIPYVPPLARSQQPVQLDGLMWLFLGLM
jgi:hypothetical protein